MKRFSFLCAALLLSLSACGVSFAQPWLTVKNAPAGTASPYLPFLLTDGTVIFQDYNNLSAWWKLTPDNTGSYVNGTWTQIASLPPGYQPYAFGSAVLADGRFVIVGGEYNSIDGINDANTSDTAIYDPKSDTWTPLSRPPFAVDQAADCPTVVLPSGQFVVGDENSSALAFLDPVTLTWTIPSASGSNTDTFVEAGFTLLPDGSFLVVDVEGAPLTERYVPSLQRWIGAGSTNPSLQENFEMGPAILRPDGTVFATGASGSNAVYTPPSTLTGAGTWKVAPSFPIDPVLGPFVAADAPASLLPDGNVLVEASPYDVSPIHIYEFDGTNLTQVDDPPGAANDTSQDGSLLPLPNGQTLFQQGNTYFYTNGGSPNPAWAPTISQFPAVVGPGGTYPIAGTQFNGLSQASAYGDDYQAATNWPLVRITNQATGHVFYARTHDHSTMGVATGSTPVSTYFDVPPSIELGASNLVVVANGIPSTPVSITIEKLKSSSVNLVSSLNPSAGGQSVTFTATVSGTGSTPSGTMTFLDGTTRLGTGTVGASGVATFSTSALIVETHAITASYSGDSTFAPSTSSALTQTVTGATPTVSVTFTPNPSNFGGTVAFKATVTGTVGVPTGVVLFYDGTTWLRGEPLVAGVATFSWPNFNAGSHSLTAHYLGDTKYAPATSSVVTPTVNPVSSTTTLTSSVNPASLAEMVTFTATVSASGTLAGTVNLYDGNTLLASQDVYSATFQVSTLSAGTHSITAKFLGTSNQLASTSSPLAEVVLSKSSSISLSSSVNPSGSGQLVYFTTNVTTPTGGTPTGTVTFTDSTDNLSWTRPLGAGGVTTFGLSSLSVGSHSFTATYSGDSTFGGSVSSVVNQVVNSKAANVYLLSSLNPSLTGQAVVLTAELTSITGGVPTGTVTFYDGTTPLGTGTLSTGFATLSVTSLSVGTHSLTVQYGGDSIFGGGTSSVVSQVVSYRPSSVSLTSSLNPSASGQAVVFRATVTSTAGGTPTGTVTFYDGTASSGPQPLIAGVATYSVSSLPVGSNSITAQYNGDVNYGASVSSALSQTVNHTVQSQTIFVINSGGTLTTLQDDGSVQSNMVSGGGHSVAVDGTGAAWSVNSAQTSVAKFSDSGSFSATYSGGGTSGATALAVDGAGLIWLVDGGGVSAFTNAGSPVFASAVSTSSRISSPGSISVDTAGSLWIANAGNNTVTEVIGVASPVVTPTVSAVSNSNPGTRP